MAARFRTGDALQVLRSLPAESVDCCVTSPPYWGLRDYGTGTWVGGSADCNHVRFRPRAPHERRRSTLDGGTDIIRVQDEANVYRETCGRCGATRVDQQLGLEPTPEQYVARMVEVFAEVRRVLAPHGTLWVNIGDSYTSGGRATHGTRADVKQGSNRASAAGEDNVRTSQPANLKPKELVGIPWRLAFALQADGWWLRSDVIWAKPNPMPESVTDRPTKSHEYLFMLTKQPRYFFDQEAVREPWADGRAGASGAARSKYLDARGDGGVTRAPQVSGRNLRTVWTITPKPLKEAHFAAFPPELAERCISASCPAEVCRTCGKPRERILERRQGAAEAEQRPKRTRGMASTTSTLSLSGNGSREWQARGTKVETVGWTDCGHDNYRPGVALDPFAGAGTVAMVADGLGRSSLGVELNPDYVVIARERLKRSRATRPASARTSQAVAS